MEKNLQISASASVSTVFNNVKNAVRDAIKAPFILMRNYYSDVIGKNISNRQAWLITELQFAFVAVVFPVDFSLVLRFVALLWFISSAIRTKASFE